MYGFHKVKNDRGIHEFKHPQFVKGHYEELANIKRKNILIGKEDEDQQAKELDAEEFIKLRNKLETTKTSLETVTQQNMNLILANKEVAGQLYSFKQDYETRLSKFFFMFYFLVNNKNRGIVRILKKTLLDLGISYNDTDQISKEQRISEASDYINNQILINAHSEHTIMNKLLNAFSFFLNTGSNELDDVYHQDMDLDNLNGKICFEGTDVKHEKYNSMISTLKPINDKFLSTSYQNFINLDNAISHLKPLFELNRKEEFSSLIDLSVNRIYDEDSDITMQEDDMDCLEQL